MRCNAVRARVDPTGGDTENRCRGKGGTVGNRAHNKDRGEGLWEIEIDALSDGARPNLFYRQVRSSVVNRAKGQHFYNLTHDGACAASAPPPPGPLPAWAVGAATPCSPNHSSNSARGAA